MNSFEPRYIHKASHYLSEKLKSVSPSKVEKEESKFQTLLSKFLSYKNLKK